MREKVKEKNMPIVLTIGIFFGIMSILIEKGRISNGYALMLLFYNNRPRTKKGGYCTFTGKIKKTITFVIVFFGAQGRGRTGTGESPTGF